MLRLLYVIFKILLCEIPKLIFSFIISKEKKKLDFGCLVSRNLNFIFFVSIHKEI